MASTRPKAHDECEPLGDEWKCRNPAVPSRPYSGEDPDVVSAWNGQKPWGLQFVSMHEFSAHPPNKAERSAMRRRAVSFHSSHEWLGAKPNGVLIVKGADDVGHDPKPSDQMQVREPVPSVL